MKKAPRIAVAILTSWWFLGAVGWAIVVWNYPLNSSLPTYAG